MGAGSRVSNITLGSMATTEWGSLAGMWAQSPGLASNISDPIVSRRCPARTCTTAGRRGGVLGEFLTFVKRKQHHPDLVVLEHHLAEGSLGGNLGSGDEIGEECVGCAHNRHRTDQS